jgi:glutamyl-tRNA reductase
MKMGIIGAGGIAGVMAGTISKMNDVECTAIAARDIERAQTFAKRYGFARAIKVGLTECPEMPHAQTLEIMRQVDIIRKQFNLTSHP